MSKIMYCLLADFYESVIIPVNEEQIRFFSDQKQQIPQLSMEEQMELLHQYFPEYDDHPSYLYGAMIQRMLEFEKLNENYQVIGDLETDNYIIKEINPYQPVEINEPAIQIEIFSEGNTLTYYAEKEITANSRLFLSGFQLASGEEIINHIQTDEASLHLHFNWERIKINEYRFNLLQ